MRDYTRPMRIRCRDYWRHVYPHGKGAGELRSVPADRILEATGCI